MKKQSVSAHRENSSLKTFVLYSAIVLVVIVISLIIKLVSVIQQSKFDGENQFTVAIVKDNKVEQVLGIDSSHETLSVVNVEGKNRSFESLDETLALVPDAIVHVPHDFPVAADFTKTMTQVAWQYALVKSEITLYDIARLSFLSKKIPQNKKAVQTMKLPLEEKKSDSLISELFTDERIALENVSIQVINASEISGMGRQFERILVNMGANVIAVSTALTPENSSEIQYFGEKTYTLQKLESLFDLTAVPVEKQPIADIVIVVGKDTSDEGEL